jgi:asparagine synthase (glutamine-hydrolysing)
VLLKEALRPYLPEEVLFRRKVGFRVPVGDWFKNGLRPLVEDLLLSSSARARQYFNAQSMENFIREHFDGVRDRQKQLWALLNFELWCRNAQ